MRFFRPGHGNTSFQVTDGILKTMSRLMGHPQVEKHERVTRVVLQLELEYPQVTFVFALISGDAAIGTGMNDIDVSPLDFAAGAADGRKKLLVNSPFEAQIGTIEHKLRVVHHSDAVFIVRGAGGAMDLHD